MAYIRKMWEHLYPFRYIIVFMVCLLKVLFIGENSFLSIYEHNREVWHLESEIKKYQEQYDADTERINELSNNTEALEKIARERYFMKTDKEDIFVFADEHEDETAE